MPSTLSRRRFLSLCGLGLGVGTAGCLDGTVPPGWTDPSGADPSTPDPTESADPTPTLPTSAVSDREARTRALSAEESYVVERLGSADCLEDWGTHATTGDERASVATRTADAVVVDLRYPYWYVSERDDVAGASRARYHVTPDGERRVDGDPVAPC